MEQQCSQEQSARREPDATTRKSAEAILVGHPMKGRIWNTIKKMLAQGDTSKTAKRTRDHYWTESGHTEDAKNGFSDTLARTHGLISEGTEDHQLLERILGRDNMFAALARVEKNNGAAGVDGMEAQDLRTFLKAEWPGIRDKILAGSYRPSPARRVEIPKPGGGTRLLGIPTALDRLIQQAMLQNLSPIFDPDFSNYSYGFRPGKSAHMAVESALDYQKQGYHFVVDIDLEKFFDRVNHDILMHLVSRKVKDARVLRLIRSYLSSGIMTDGIVSASREGTRSGTTPCLRSSGILLESASLARRSRRS